MAKPGTITTFRGTELRVPSYDAKCITLIPDFIRNVLLGKTLDGLANSIEKNKTNTAGVKRVVFFLVDGFGNTQWKTYRQKYEALQLFERSGTVMSIDSVFPATTPVALTALNGNGMKPAAHGLIDWWLYIEEIDKIIATLPFSPMGSNIMDSLLNDKADPGILFNGTTTYESFGKEGISSYVLLRDKYKESVYSKAAYKNSQIVPHMDTKSLFDSLNNQLGTSTDPSYFYVYWGDIDAAGHAHGLDSQEYANAVKDYFEAMHHFFQSLDNDLAKDTLFLISADHGQININPDETLYLDKIEGLYDLFQVSKNGKTILPWGGPREVFVAIKEGHIDEAERLIDDAIGEQVEIVRSQDAYQKGLFGNVSQPHKDLQSRIGTILILPKGNNTAWYHHPDGEDFTLLGHHGGLSDDELLVPFGVMRGTS